MTELAIIHSLYRILRWILKEGAPTLEIPINLVGLKDGSDAMGRARQYLHDHGITSEG